MIEDQQTRENLATLERLAPAGWAKGNRVWYGKYCDEFGDRVFEEVGHLVHDDQVIIGSMKL
jgi:hypothetical protein